MIAGTGISNLQLSLNGALPEAGIIGASMAGNRLVLTGTQDVITEHESREAQHELTPVSVMMSIERYI